MAELTTHKASVSLRNTALKTGRRDDFLLRLDWQQEPVLLEGEPEGFYGYHLAGDTPDDGAFVSWSLKQGRFELAGDRLGLYPLYYFQIDSQLVISNSLALLAERFRLETDSEAVGIFLRLGFYLGSDTAFVGVKRAEGQLKVLLDETGLAIESRRPVIRRMLQTSSTAMYQQLFANALQKLRGCRLPLYVPLTGGKDSRHILLTAYKLRLPIKESYTTRVLSPHSNDDVTIARELCKRLQVPHQVLASEQRLHNAEQQKNIRTNFETYDHFWINQAGQYMAQKSSGLVLDGFGGDVLSQSKIVTKQMHRCYQQQDWTTLTSLIAPKDPYYEAYFQARPEFLVSQQRLQTRLQVELQKFADEVIPVKSFYFWNRSRRAIAISSFRQLNGNSQAFFPYMQADLFDFLIALPEELYFSQQFHASCIAQAFPDFVDIPYASNMAQGDALAAKRTLYNVFAMIKEIAQADFIAAPMRLRAMLSCLRSSTVKDSVVTFFYFFRPMIYLNQLRHLRFPKQQTMGHG
ncbi:hypothetical protein AEST_30430 [Alishewanella aestuarii B11]|uniref:asparagine synthase (glutamine-hydrolyzing) n=1 Tax=Alishewanella aestuarii B11 TaxID=1197174 RepID=J2IC13_9ALTE|nr:hypothetical protein [Alishewanella aestuarii]EJI84209.1 hypothetical protein AEST_30430 [Alishewanella aestuarii B11]